MAFTLTDDEIGVIMIVIDCSLTKDKALNTVKVKYPHMYNAVSNEWDDLHRLYLVYKQLNFIYN
jgi:CO dehydrogenase/acetyl-CoA synthase gamma subunit (corrinoid Fe-S protein)